MNESTRCTRSRVQKCVWDTQGLRAIQNRNDKKYTKSWEMIDEEEKCGVTAYGLSKHIIHAQGVLVRGGRDAGRPLRLHRRRVLNFLTPNAANIEHNSR